MFNLFSGPEHQRADWLGIHKKICQLLIPLRAPIPFLGSEDERQHRKQQQIVRQVRDEICCRMAKKSLVNNLKCSYCIERALIGKPKTYLHCQDLFCISTSMISVIAARTYITVIIF